MEKKNNLNINNRLTRQCNRRNALNIMEITYGRLRETHKTKRRVLERSKGSRPAKSFRRRTNSEDDLLKSEFDNIFFCVFSQS